MNNLEILNGITHLKRNDSILRKVIAMSDKFNIEASKKYFESLVDSIISQQLSIHAADKIIKRFHSFMNYSITAKKILSSETEELRKLGISYAKIKYIKDLAHKKSTKQISFKNLENQSDDEIIAHLVTVKGIGVWTAQMFLIFTLGRLNILPTTDLGIRKAISKLYKFDSLPTDSEISNLSHKNKWAPYNSIAAWYLWKSLDTKQIF